MGAVAPSPSSAAPLFLVDGFNVLWRGHFGFPAPIFSRDKQRNLTGLFAFFALLRVTLRDDLDTAPAEVCVVLDGEHGSAERKDTDAGYKANRESTPAALEPLQFLTPMKESLDAYGIAWVEIDDAEADDVVGTLVHRYPDRTIRIMSADQDYYQLLAGERVRIINRSRKASKRIITDAEVHERYGVAPDQWPDYRALTGDKSDNLPGVKGIGAKTAADLLAGGLTLDELRAGGRLTGTKGAAIEAAWTDVLRWRDLSRMRRDVPVAWQATGQASPALPKPADVIEKLGLW
ncbi:5'-3' exonuclease H3TH domain-containing protein [Sphaerisporangium sp. NPDC051017]|uniref:5'-3' exonuclease n=1 Tax=Sphaerisporangium sp. NPDC051017 TaxID=3154636 RepID=UPI003448D8EE